MLILSRDLSSNSFSEPSLEAKVAFLKRRDVYPHTVSEVVARETHMSWVFLIGDEVYKLKKPVRFPYLDFSTLPRREAACRAEVTLNRRLAPDVYLKVQPLMATADGLSLDGGGRIVDWLVVMRQLDERNSLERVILDKRVEAVYLDRLIDRLVQFYQQAPRTFVQPSVQQADLHRTLDYNKRVLLDARLAMPTGLVRQIDAILRAFLAHRARLFERRVHRRWIVDGHGDLRPEHVWLEQPAKIIDCLEFNARLRTVDPFDDLAFLSLECERLGAADVGEYIREGVARGLRNGVPEELFLFYRCYRAMLRARLAIAHLLEVNPRTPEKWPRQARAYLHIAFADACRLKRLLRRRSDRSTHDPGAAGRSLRRTAAPT